MSLLLTKHQFVSPHRGKPGLCLPRPSQCLPTGLCGRSGGHRLGAGPVVGCPWPVPSLGIQPQELQEMDQAPSSVLMTREQALPLTPQCR